jgi:hypothetical protein
MSALLAHSPIIYCQCKYRLSVTSICGPSIAIYKSILRVRILSGVERTGGVPLLEVLAPPPLGPGLDLLLELGVGPALPLPLPLILAESVLVWLLMTPGGAIGSFSLHGILSMNQPHHVVAAASLCLSSLLRSNVAR